MYMPNSPYVGDLNELVILLRFFFFFFFLIFPYVTPSFTFLPCLFISHEFILLKRGDVL